jgi:hypothetical protein
VFPVDPAAEAEILAVDAIILGIGAPGLTDSSSWGPSGDMTSSGNADELIVVAVNRAEASRLALGAGRLVTVAITGR